jgi:hypothetical protein
MPIRIGIFEAASVIYQQTGISLLKYSGASLIPVEQSFGGEAGAFYFVPLLAKIFTISSKLATWYFFLGLVVIGTIVASSAFVFLSETLKGKSLSIIGICALGSVSWAIGDVYIGYFFAIAFFPWIIILLKQKFYKTLIGYCFVLGIIGECAHFIRSYSAVPLFIGTAVAIIVYYKNIRKIILPLSALLIGVLVVKMHISAVVKKRDHYLRQQGYIYEDDPIEHTFWHNIYMGMGFISNDYQLEFSDSCSAKKVKKISPQAQYLKPEYETTLRNEILKLTFKNPHYVLRVLFAKFGVLLYFLLLFTNIGLIAAYYYPKPLYIEVSYWAMILVSALPGILTIPITTYLLGFITACVLYGIHSIVYALNMRKLFFL